MLTVSQSLSLQFATQCILSSSITKEQGNGQSYIEQDLQTNLVPKWIY